MLLFVCMCVCVCKGLVRRALMNELTQSLGESANPNTLIGNNVINSISWIEMEPGAWKRTSKSIIRNNNSGGVVGGGGWFVKDLIILILDYVSADMRAY